VGRGKVKGRPKRERLAQREGTVRVRRPQAAFSRLILLLASLSLPPGNAHLSMAFMQATSKFRSMLTALLALGVTLFLTGCFQVEQLIKVKPDGSGNVEMTVVITKEALAMMKELSKDNPNAKSPIDEMMSEDKGKEQAGNLGEGVTFVKSEKVTNAAGEGVKMIFAFTDVTKLKPSMDMQGGPGGGVPKDAAVAFEFTKGSPASLVVKTVHGGEKAKPDNVPDDKEFEQAAQMMKGMKLTMAIEVVGTIAETDAAHHAGNRVTLAEVPFDEILKSKDAFIAMSKAGTWGESVKVLKEIPGVKVDPKETITIKFK
jgi:hypothetical protein